MGTVSSLRCNFKNIVSFEIVDGFTNQSYDVIVHNFYVLMGHVKEV
jgi:hypothetical protein